LLDFIAIAVSLMCAFISAGLVMLLIWITYLVMNHD